MSDFELVKQMPFSLEAEQALLGAIIIDASLLNDVVMLRADDFYLEQHKLIFSAIKELFAENKCIDIVTLINRLKSSEANADFDVPKYIKLICDLGASCANVSEYETIIKEKSTLRLLINATKDISERAYSQETEANKALDYAEQRIYDIAGDNINNGFTHIKDILRSNFETFQFIQQNPDAISGVKTCFSELDNYFVSLGEGDLVIVGARPGVGKTTFCLNIAANVGKHYRDGEVAIFSLEMSKESLVNRVLASEATIDNYTIKKATFTNEEWDALANASSDLSKTQIVIDDTSNISTSEMKAKLRRLKNCKIVIIDYLQLITSERFQDNKVLQVADITRSLKLLAKDMKIPIILCSQLSRPPKNVKEKRPLLSDLRDSGAIEQDADIVMLLYRDDYYDNTQNTDKSNASPDKNEHPEIECIIAKNRHGATGTAKFAWHGQYFKFIPIEENLNAPK